MQEVLLYGITKEPIRCFHGDHLEVYEYGRYAPDKLYPCSDGEYLIGADVDNVVDIKSLPIHTMRIATKDHHGDHYHDERLIAFTPEFVKEIGGDPVEMKENINTLQEHNRTLFNKIYDLEYTTEQLKSNLSTASLWKRLKWVFTGVEV
jgi:hypothetical protein